MKINLELSGDILTEMVHFVLTHLFLLSQPLY